MNANGDVLAQPPGNREPSWIANPYLFTGRRYDPETAWYHYRTRYLDPAAGRFTTRDTIGIWGDPWELGNGYSFVGNNSLAWLDPFGLITFKDLVKTNKCLKALRKLMWELSKKLKREVGGLIRISSKGRLAVQMKIGGQSDVQLQTLFPKGRKKPKSAVGTMHTHQSPGHERGPSDDDKKFGKKHDLAGVVFHWKDVPSDPKNKTNPTKTTKTFFGPNLDKEIPKINDNLDAAIELVDDLTNTKIQFPLPEECKPTKDGDGGDCDGKKSQ